MASKQHQNVPIGADPATEVMVSEVHDCLNSEQWFSLYDRIQNLYRSDSASFKTQTVLEGLFADIRLMTQGWRCLKGIIAFSITDRGALYSSYMSFVQNGAVFVPTSRNYELGDEVFMLLKLMDDTTPMPIGGKVVWVTPAGAQGNKSPGVGVQFADDDNGETKSTIEQHLAAALQGDRPTHTM